jgi:hypothetical protein
MSLEDRLSEAVKSARVLKWMMAILLVLTLILVWRVFTL